MKKIITSAAILAAVSGAAIASNPASAIIDPGTMGGNYTAGNSTITWGTVENASYYKIRMFNPEMEYALTSVYSDVPHSADIFEVINTYCELVSGCADLGVGDYIFTITAHDTNDKTLDHSIIWKATKTRISSNGSAMISLGVYNMPSDATYYNHTVDFNGGMSPAGASFSGPAAQGYIYFTPDAANFNAITPPEGKIYAEKVDYNGTIIGAGEPFLINQDSTMTVLWKNADGSEDDLEPDTPDTPAAPEQKESGTTNPNTAAVSPAAMMTIMGLVAACGLALVRRSARR